MRNKGVRTTAPGGRDLSADVRFGLVMSIRRGAGYKKHSILRWHDGDTDADVYALVKTSYRTTENTIEGDYYEVWNWIGHSAWECIEPEATENTILAEYGEDM